MTTYGISQTLPPPLLQSSEVFLIASGDLRLSANHTCWPAQADMERLLSAAFTSAGPQVRVLSRHKKQAVLLENKAKNAQYQGMPPKR